MAARKFLIKPYILLFYFFYLLHSHANGQIRVSENLRFLSTSGNQPFFWLGDTEWQLFYKLSREEVIQVLDTRKEQGFNVIQVVALDDDLQRPNYYGDIPLIDLNPEKLLITPGNDSTNSNEYDFWDHIEFVIKAARDRGMYIGLLPTWGDKVAVGRGTGPIIFNEGNARNYSRSIANRFSGLENIIWILGGDRDPVYTIKRNEVINEYNDLSVWRAMAFGIEDILGNDVFLTYHPQGSTSRFLQNESWMDMNTFQSGHFKRETDGWNWVTRDIGLSPVKPVLDMEPCYEDHPVDPWDGKWTKERGYFSPYDIRRRIYREIFAGACGVTYGHHQVWQFVNDGKFKSYNLGDTIIGWQKAIHSTGANQMKYLKALMLSRPYFTRIPDQAIILSGEVSSFEDLVVACRDEKSSYAMIYLPKNKTVDINLAKVSGKKKVQWWFNLQTGKILGMKKTIKSKTRVQFIPPSDCLDCVLVIDDSKYHYPPPGSRL